MIDAPGTITALDGEYAIVRMEESGCGRCHEEGGCGGNNLGKLFCNTPRTFRVLNPGASGVGDRVNVVIADGAIRRSALLAYGLPLLALFAGALAGLALGGDGGAMLGAVIGLSLSWLALRQMQRHAAPDARTQPYIRY